MKLQNCVLIAVYAALLFGCDSGNSASPDYSNPFLTLENSMASYSEKVESVEDVERANPSRFISVTYNTRENLIGELVINGTVSNEATVASYKDLVLRVSYYSKTESLLAEEEFTIYEYFGPGKSTSFKKKLPYYRNTRSVDLSFVSAKGLL